MIPNEATNGNINRPSLLDRLLVPVIIVLVGVAAFGLGRLSMGSASKPSLVVHQEGEASTTPVSTVY